jgi:hypothetical protein
MRLYVSSLLFALVTALLIPITAFAQADVRCVAVYDSTGVRVGPASQSEQITTLLLNQDGRIVRLNVTRSRLEGSSSVYFTRPNCSGDAYMKAAPLQPLASKPYTSNDVWYPDTLAEIEVIDPQSQLSGGSSCASAGGPYGSYPALKMTLPAFAPPFHLEPEACYTPEDPDPEQIINACVKNKGGALRIVADPEDCTPRETPISWVGQ